MGFFRLNIWRSLLDQKGRFSSSGQKRGQECTGTRRLFIQSFACHFGTVGTAVKEDALELMMHVVSHHSNDLPAILSDSGLSHADRAAHLNALKMNCYLLTGLMDAFEMETCNNSCLEADPGRKSRKNHAKTSGSLWEEEREPLLQLLTRLLQLDLRQLWGGLAVEEEFVSLMTGSCYRILENPSIGLQKYRVTREALTHLLAAALVHRDHMFSATLKITQMLQHFEHVAPVFAQAVSLWAKEYGLKSLVGELLREIGQKCPQDLAREASGVKGYATFISELAEQIPALVLSNMSVLLPHLDGEVHFCKVTCPEKSNGRDAPIQFFCLIQNLFHRAQVSNTCSVGLDSALT